MERQGIWRGLAAGTMAFGLLAGPAAAQWKPEKPITVIVPWGAGGSTDQVVRVVAQEVEKALGQKVVVVNQPGASGAIGTKSVLDAPKDGLTIASGAAKDLGTYAVSGALDTRIEDWHLYLAVVNASVIGVNASTPFKTLPDLIQAMKDKPGSLKVATAGITSSGGDGLRQLQTAFGVEAKQITYDGGNPAVIATAGGETDATTQLGVEQAEMIRAGKLRGLAVLSARPLALEGVPPIDPVTKFKADFKLADNYFGIFVPKGAPKEVTDTLDRIWKEVMPKSEALAKYAESRGAIVAVLSGEEARKAVMPAIQIAAWALVDRKQSKIDPASIGIEKP
ncbi:Bug family tripartite tricarboxylate transporter substrate binding protein [Prosthecomicrobium sp. N25]|uniref:Bug family tripartite tricarboxylate transporter substrate binding protein n=1 Tax=Prosthecomicrobium sp. N25 TaxID=3129254 RepID=UPI0030789A18